MPAKRTAKKSAKKAVPKKQKSFEESLWDTATKLCGSVEDGLPYSVTHRILDRYELGKDVDEFLLNLPTVESSKLKLSPFEQEMFLDALENL